MKLGLVAELEKIHDDVHGCYRPSGGPCFYIASDVTASDYGRCQGRRFVAAIELRDGTLKPLVSLTFLVATMAQLVRASLIGPLDDFCREVGLERLREALERDYNSERDEEVVLTRESDEVEFLRPVSTKAIQNYKALKDQIIHVLASRHAQGQKRVPAFLLLEGLCDQPQVINRALNELVELSLIRDVNHTGGMRLTAAGQELAEETIVNEFAQRETSAVANAMQFDFFISYASEDRETAEAFEKSLTTRGYSVWRDRGQLTLGDSLIAKINEGLSTARYAIVVLSEYFLRKNWPRAELDALQARAIGTGTKVILPVRLRISHEEMAKHLPLLGDKFTIAFENNLEEVAAEIERAAGR